MSSTQQAVYRSAKVSVMKIYIKFRKGVSIRNFYLLAIFSVGFYLMCLIALVFNTDNRWIFKAAIIPSPNGNNSGIIPQTNKSIIINKSKSWENKNAEFFRSDERLSPSSSQNYFQHTSRLLEMQRLVDTRTCKIPDFDVFDQDAQPFIKIAQPVEKCNETHYNWSRVYKNKLIINKSQVELDGYKLYKGFCCYKVVERVTITDEEQKSQRTLKNADNYIKYSNCIDINAEVTELQHEFIMVECGWIKFLPVAVTYRAFHGSAIIQGSQRSQNVEKKINYWKSQTQEEEERLPPNILILGLDSTSRLNFRRNMFKTRKILEELEAVEMMGYTKVGENTFPNFVPLTTGYSEEDLVKICYESHDTPQDSCPYIWKRFDAANYITAHSEDSPVLAIYNYLKTGFINQPVDYYLRPFMQSAHDYGHPPFYVIRREYMDCIGQQTNDEAILSYVESVLEIGQRNKTPVYSVAWSTDGSHGDLNNIQLVDDTYATFLRRALDKGYLENTILIFMGDHGYRYGPFRETLLGYYEDKLPNMWIGLPPWIREEFPEWQTALEINSRRLTTPFTVYWTLNQVLEMFSSLESPQVGRNSKTMEFINRKHIQSFFEAVPEDNTCADVGVPEQFCACYLPQKVLLNDPLLKEAAVAALNVKNGELPSECAPLKVKEIFAGTFVAKSVTLKRFVVAFTTDPGNFVLEVEIDYFAQNETFSVLPSVHRTSAINSGDIGCIKDAKLELFCYCA